MVKNIFAFASAMAAFACQGNIIDPDDIPGNVPTGDLVVYLDAASLEDTLSMSIEEVGIRFEDVRVQRENNRWLAVGVGRQDIDMLRLRGGDRVAIGRASVFEGAYDKIQLIVADSWVVVDGVEHELAIAGISAGDGLQLDASFFVDESVTAEVLVRWDIDTQLDESDGAWTLGSKTTVDVDLSR